MTLYAPASRWVGSGHPAVGDRLRCKTRNGVGCFRGGNGGCHLFNFPPNGRFRNKGYDGPVANLDESISRRLRLETMDLEFNKDVREVSFEKHELTRVFAVNRTFTKVDFTHSIINACYFRNCTFIDCKFTGVAFKDSSFRGSTFKGCTFRYSFWDKTFLERWASPLSAGAAEGRVISVQRSVHGTKKVHPGVQDLRGEAGE